MKAVGPIGMAVLAGVLVLSNGWWLWRSLDTGVSRTHREHEYRDVCGGLKGAMVILPRVARHATRAEVIAAARKAFAGSDPFEKEGATWVGHLGFYFDEQGRLERVTPSWEPFYCD